jgi:hypothetical protein
MTPAKWQDGALISDRLFLSSETWARCRRNGRYSESGISALVEPFAHLFTSFEKGHALLIDHDVGTGTRIASGTRWALFDRECAEAAQLHPITARHRGDDFAENSVHDLLDVALMRCTSSDLIMVRLGILSSVVL